MYRCMPYQALRATFGPRGKPPYYPIFPDEDHGLQALDAPALMPAGSMLRSTLPSGAVILKESLSNREAQA